MTDQEKEQNYKDRIKELEDKVDDLANKLSDTQSKLYNEQSKCSQLDREKGRLLNIIEKLAEGMANK